MAARFTLTHLTRVLRSGVVLRRIECIETTTQPIKLSECWLKIKRIALLIMKSKEAKKYLSSSAMNPNSPLAQDQDYVWRDYSIIKAIEIAEDEMIQKACLLFKQILDGVFQGDMSKKMTEDFKKLMEG